MKHYISFLILILVYSTASHAQKEPEKKSAMGHNFWGWRPNYEHFRYIHSPQAVNFKYISPNSGYVIEHRFDFKNLERMINIVPIGFERNFKSGLYLNIISFSFSPFYKHVQNAYISSGAGYIFSLTKKDRLLLRPRIDFAFGSVGYKFGGFTDTTGQGFVVKNNNNVGDYIDQITYSNNISGICPSVDIVYQTSSAICFFMSLSYFKVLSSNESVTIKYHSKHKYGKNDTPSSHNFKLSDNLFFDDKGNVIRKNIISQPDNYFIRIGIILTGRL
ncbi:MAG: hypothetical protein K2X86_05235 [Cytophagaceae bacterium]|nr:hypothetical protein [Cytophagaceae bacterium]